jgi:tRNA pseudouridine(38-40) synthase
MDMDAEHNDDDDEHGGARKRANDGVERRTIALLFGYLGSNYQGLQINPGAHSVESVLYRALCRAGVLELPADADAPDLGSVAWQRTARTDKGVHAAGGIVSFRARLVDGLVDAVNRELPYDVRVFGFRVTTNKFRCKEQCEARTYEMRVPTFVLLTPTPVRDADLYAYRVPPARLAQLRATMAQFEGTHNFHNYTSGRSPTDPSCKRFMRAITVDEPVVIAGIEFFTVRLIGQSFMLHQIRKMVGTAVVLLRYDLPPTCLKRTLTTDKFTLPLIPGAGLAVVRCWFTGYDRIVSTTPGFGAAAQLTWTAEQPLIDAYLRDVIIPHVAALEHGNYQEERRRQRASWLKFVTEQKAAVEPGAKPIDSAALAAELAALAAEDAAEAAAVGDDDNDDAAAAAADDVDDEKPPTASSSTAPQRAQDVPSSVRTSRKQPFKHWCAVADRYPPDRAAFLLHAALRPANGISSFGAHSGAIDKLPLEQASGGSAVLTFRSEILPVPGKTGRYAAGPVSVRGTLLVGADLLNRPLQLGIVRASDDAKPTIVLADVEPQAAPARVEVSLVLPDGDASLVPYETINLIGRYLVLLQKDTGEILQRAVIGHAFEASPF